MRKTDKSVLAHNLKAAVLLTTGELGHTYYVVGGGHLLHIVTWSVIVHIVMGL